MCRPLPGSIDVEKESLQVGRLGLIDVDRMVEGQTVLLENADAPARLMGGLENDLLEEALVHEMGAGEGQDQARRPDPLEGQPVDIFVAAAGPNDVGPFLGEGRGIEDDEIVV